MIELSDYHPEFRHTWHLRLYAHFVQLADVQYQREKWASPEYIDDLEDLYCGLFDDDQIEVFLTLYDEWLNESVKLAIKSALNEITVFTQGFSRNDWFCVTDWIDTPPWRECVKAGKLILRAIEQDGWWADSRQRID